VSPKQSGYASDVTDEEGVKIEPLIPVYKKPFDNSLGVCGILPGKKLNGEIAALVEWQ